MIYNQFNRTLKMVSNLISNTIDGIVNKQEIVENFAIILCHEVLYMNKTIFQMC